MKKHIQTQEEWENEVSLKILSFVRSEIYLDLRFLDIALSALTPKPDANLSSLATDGTFVFFSSKQMMRVFKSNAHYLNRAYLHTVLHCMFFHLWIAGGRDRDLWDLACDIAVEYTIDGMKKPCTNRILSLMRKDVYEALEAEKRGISAAIIYRWLSGKEPEEVIALRKEFYTDDHRFWPKEEKKNAVQQQASKNWDKIARQTSMEQKRRGDEQKEGEELLAAQLQAEKGRRSYRDFLHKFSVIREELHCDPEEFDLNFYTYGLKLYKNMPLIEPVETRESKKIQEFVIVIDTSYSTSGTLIQNFLRETYGILTEENSFFKDSRIHIIQCDNQVRMDQEVRTKEELERLLETFTVLGGGGTDFRPAFSYVEELRREGKFKNLCGLLYFTDGKGIYPGKKPEYKTAFLFLDDYDNSQVPPWAIRMRLEMDGQ